MSKAFTRESDADQESPIQRPRSALPLGAKNYLTPDGANRLRGQMAQLVQTERPKLTANPADAETKQRLQTLDQRIASLEHTLESAIVVPVPAPPWE